MADNRTPREVTSRTTQMREWKPAEMLPSPNPEPGYSFRWIRVQMAGNDDPTNASAKMREGWEPVRAQDHPELLVDPIAEGRFKGGIEVGGLILMKTPTEFVKQRNAYYNNQASQQMEAVDNDLMRLNDPRMPLFKERNSRVSFGNG